MLAELPVQNRNNENAGTGPWRGHRTTEETTMTRGILALCMALALAACVDRSEGKPYTEAVAAWEGRTGAELIDSWGDPTEITDGSKGSKVYIYKTEFYTNNTNTVNSCTTRFQVDKKGKIVGTKVERDGSELACTAGNRI